MTNRLAEILEEIRPPEQSVVEEIRIREDEFQYTVRKRAVVFAEEFGDIQKKFGDIA